MPSHGNSVRMDFIYNSFADVFDEKTMIVTWDTLLIILTLSIFITLVIFIWITRLDLCQKSKWKCEDINTDKKTPRCLDAEKSMFG